MSVSALTLTDLVGVGVEVRPSKDDSSSNESSGHMHDFIVVARNQGENVESGSIIAEDVGVVEKGFVNKPSVSVIICVELNIPKIVFDEKKSVSVSEVFVSDKRTTVGSKEEMSNDFVNRGMSETIASVVNLPKFFDVDEATIVGNVASGTVCPSILFGEENKGSLSKCSVEVDAKVVDPLRGKYSGCNVVEGNVHTSSQEICEEAPAFAEVDEVAHLRAGDDSEDEEVRHMDVEEGA